MKVLQRLSLALATVATVGTGATLGLSTTSFGAALLGTASRGLVMTANAGGGGGGGAMTLTVAPNAELLGKVDAVVTVNYVCDQLFDPFTGLPVLPGGVSGFINVQVSQRVGNGVANGFGGASVTPACDRSPTFPGTVNTATVTVTPFSDSFKNGTAVGQASGQVCETAFSSFGPGNCDFGQSASTVISIKN